MEIKWKNSVIKSIIMKLILIEIIFSILFIVWSPSIVFNLIKPTIISNVINAINTAVTKDSYIWRWNREARMISLSSDIVNLLKNYQKNKRDIKIENTLKSMLHTQVIGKTANGMNGLSATSYIVISDGKDNDFYLEESFHIFSIIKKSEWFKSLPKVVDKNSETYIYSPVIKDRITNREVICSVLPILTSDNHQYYVMHIMDFKYIKEQYKILEKLGIKDYMIIQKNKILYNNSNYRFNLNELSSSLFNSLTYETKLYNDKNDFFFSALRSYEKVRTIIHIDKSNFLKPYKKIFYSINFLFIIISTILIIFVYFSLKKLLTRILYFSKTIEHAEKFNYDISLKVDGEDEISNLMKTFNTMIKHINNDFQKQLENEKKEQKMQYSLLVSAIDPHFIYNTLNTITFLARMNENEKIVEVNKALIGTLKDRLTIKNCKIFDSIKIEKEVLDQYMTIQKHLAHSTIDYSFDISEDIKNIEIPKNILQPIVENSIKHGLLTHKDNITQKIFNGIIKVSIKNLEDMIEIEIFDNGSGLSQEKIDYYFKKDVRSVFETELEHIGIFNIRMRLNHLYKNSYKIDVKSSSNNGTKIILLLPKKYESI